MRSTRNVKSKEIKQSQKEKFDAVNVYSLVGQVGYTITIPLILCLVGGILVDNRFQTKPLFTLVGLFLGMSTSFYSLYRLIKPYIKK